MAGVRVRRLRIYSASVFSPNRLNYFQDHAAPIKQLLNGCATALHIRVFEEKSAPLGKSTYAHALSRAYTRSCCNKSISSRYDAARSAGEIAFCRHDWLHACEQTKSLSSSLIQHRVGIIAGSTIKELQWKDEQY